jgi:hypothetical protein
MPYGLQLPWLLFQVVTDNSDRIVVQLSGRV